MSLMQKLMQRKTVKKSRGQGLMGDLFTLLYWRKDKGKREPERKGSKNFGFNFPSVQQKNLFRKYLRMQLLSKCPRIQMAYLKGMFYRI